MDYSKLSAVSDSLKGNKPKVVAAQPVQVTDENPLNQIPTVEHIADTAKPKTVVKKQLVILDSVGIKRLASLSREDRRAFLAKCTDSERRRVLTQLRKVRDSGFSEKLGYKLLDDLLANAVFDPSKFNLDSLQKFMDTQEYFEPDESVARLVTAVTSGTFDANADADLVEAFSNQLEGNSRFQQVVSTQGKTPDPVDENLDDDLGTDRVEMEYTDDVADSVRQLAAADSAIFIAHQLKPSALVDSAASHIAAFVIKGYDFNKVTDSYWSEFDKAFDDQFKEITEFEAHAEDEEEFKNRYGITWREALKQKRDHDAIADSLQQIKDAEAALDKLADAPFVNEQGLDETPVEETPIIKLLSEALEEYADGNSEKLDVLLNTSISEGEQQPDQETPDEKPEDNPDETSDETSDETPDETENLKDSAIKLAKLIKEHKTDNSIVDALKLTVKRNFKVTDCDAPYCCECAECQAPMVPCTHDEYQTMCPPVVPDFIMPLIQATYGNTPEPLPFETYDIQGPCIQCNTDLGPQTYVATACEGEGSAMEQLQQELEQAEASNWPKIVGSRCCTLDSLMKTLALTNNLSCCDSRFYKKHFNDSAWSFDEVPTILANQGVQKPGKIMYGDSANGTKVTLFGTTYTVL